jgi:hypothetical protein
VTARPAVSDARADIGFAAIGRVRVTVSKAGAAYLDLTRSAAALGGAVRDGTDFATSPTVIDIIVRTGWPVRCCQLQPGIR